MPSRGHGNPRRGISVRSRRGWGPGASEKETHMRDRFITALVVIAATALIGQAQTAIKIPRMRDGKPDLQGMYDLAMLTPVERPTGLPAVLTDEQAAKLEKQAIAAQQAGSLPIAGDRSAPPKGGDGSVGPAGNVGGYNSFWIDRGSHYSIVDGQKRSSIVID